MYVNRVQNVFKTYPTFMQNLFKTYSRPHLKPFSNSLVSSAREGSFLWLLIDSSRTKAFQELLLFISRTRRYLAGHELSPNRDVKRVGDTQHASVCYQEDCQSPM